MVPEARRAKHGERGIRIEGFVPTRLPCHAATVGERIVGSGPVNPQDRLLAMPTCTV
jgi:hypothetical protein